MNSISISVKKYRLPITNLILSEAQIWGSHENQPIMLRPKDLSIYGLPEASVHDLIYKASSTKDPIPFIKLGRKTLIPRVAFESWLLRQAHVSEISTE